MPVEVPYSVVPDAPSTPGGGAVALPPAPPGFDFLGTGVLTPFRRGPSDIVSGSGPEHVRSLISQVLGVRADSDYTTGELPWRPEFGSLLHFLRHRKNDQVTAELARVYVAEALGRWLPQVRLKDVETQKASGPSDIAPGNQAVLLVRILYDIIGLNRSARVLFPNEQHSVAV